MDRAHDHKSLDKQLQIEKMPNENTLSKTDFLTCQRILTLMVITGFMVHYMIRINISIAIVEMVSKNNSNETSNQVQWNENQRSKILGLFYWGFLLTAIPGGRLSEVYGTRLVLGTAMLISSILTILTPLACYIHYYCVIFIRFTMGLALGVSWPSIPPLAVKWVAPSDSAKFMSNTMACALGAALTLPLCGYLIAYLGWPSTFYITGAISAVWTFFWFYLVYDSPRQHPRITKTEKEMLEKEIRVIEDSTIKTKVPWSKIFISGPVWAIIVADACLQFNTNTIFNELPSYMDKILHYDIKQNGFLSSLPYFFTYIMAIISSHIGDRWVKTKKFTLISIRKGFTLVSFFAPNVLYILQIIWGYDATVSVLVFILTQGFLAASTAGFISNSIDISPAYSGTIFGLALTAGASTGFIISEVIAAITHDNVTFERWRYIFSILIGINTFGAVVYYLFASSSLQDWNPKSDENEMKKLNSTQN